MLFLILFVALTSLWYVQDQNVDRRWRERERERPSLGRMNSINQYCWYVFDINASTFCVLVCWSAVVRTEAFGTRTAPPPRPPPPPPPHTHTHNPFHASTGWDILLVRTCNANISSRDFNTVHLLFDWYVNWRVPVQGQPSLEQVNPYHSLG